MSDAPEDPDAPDELDRLDAECSAMERELAELTAEREALQLSIALPPPPKARRNWNRLFNVLVVFAVIGGVAIAGAIGVDLEGCGHQTHWRGTVVSSSRANPRAGDGCLVNLREHPCELEVTCGPDHGVAFRSGGTCVLDAHGQHDDQYVFKSGKSWLDVTGGVGTLVIDDERGGFWARVQEHAP